MKSKVLITMILVGILAAVGLAGLSGCSSTGAAAQDGQPVNVNVGSQQTGIWVNGQGKVTVTPDIANVTLGISAQSSSVADAQSQAATAMEKVMSALTGNGVAKNDIKTQNFNIQRLTRYDKDTQREVVTGYQVNNTVTAKIRVIDNVGKIIDAVAQAGGDLTRINGINFSVEKPETYQKQARELAMKDAKAKAEQIASLAGVTLGKPTFVSENSYTPYAPYPEAMYRSDAAAGAPVPTTPISPGELDITLNVQVTYAIQ